MNGTVREAIAEAVRVELARKRISQRSLASALQMSQTGIWRRLNGDTDFTGSQLAVVADFVGVPVGDLFPAGKSSQT